MTAAPILDEALAFAARGWRIFPLHVPTANGCSCGNPACHSIGKHPRTGSGHHEATTNPAQVHSWWSRWPDANVGLPTGPSIGAWVLDVDPDHEGDDTLARLEAEHGPLPPTLTARTGSGGRHLFFRWQPEIKEVRNLQGKDRLPGLDVRGDGGYIVAAPSLHRSGQFYRWEGTGAGAPLAEAPAWLYEALWPTPNPRATPAPTKPLPAAPAHQEPPTDLYDPLAARLADLASGDDAESSAIAATLWAMATILVPRAHHLGADLYFTECCGSYVFTIEDTPGIKTCRSAFATLSDQAHWQEVSPAHARRLRAPVRRLKPGGHYGRLLILHGAQLATIKQAWALTKNRTAWSPPPLPPLPDNCWTQVEPRRPIEPGKLGAVRCPYHDDHHPSLVLKHHQDRPGTGTGICLACHQTVAVRFDPDGRVLVRLPRRELPAEAAETPPSCSTCGNDRNSRSRGAPAQAPGTSERGPGRSWDRRIQPPLPSPARGHRAARSPQNEDLEGKTCRNPLGCSVGALLRPAYDGRIIRTRGHRLCGDLLSILQRDDRRSLSPSAISRAEEVAACLAMLPEADLQNKNLDITSWLPTPLLSGAAMEPSDWIPATVKRRDGSTSETLRPLAWAPSTQEWISWDLDDLDPLPDDPGQLQTLAEKAWTALRHASAGELDGSWVALQSGPHGLHLHARLKHPRRAPSAWWQETATRCWYKAAGDAALAALGGTGLVDMACCSAGRWWRRPGWRVLETGKTFRARVAAQRGTAPGPEG